MTVMKVRTIGTNRASTMARLPYLSKKPCVFRTCSGLNRRDLGLSNTAGPAACPIQ
jgi:hypothetical protein